MSNQNHLVRSSTEEENSRHQRHDDYHHDGESGSMGTQIDNSGDYPPRVLSSTVEPVTSSSIQPNNRRNPYRGETAPLHSASHHPPASELRTPSHSLHSSADQHQLPRIIPPLLHRPLLPTSTPVVQSQDAALPPYFFLSQSSGNNNHARQQVHPLPNHHHQQQRSIASGGIERVQMGVQALACPPANWNGQPLAGLLGSEGNPYAAFLFNHQHHHQLARLVPPQLTQRVVPTGRSVALPHHQQARFPGIIQAGNESNVPQIPPQNLLYLNAAAAAVPQSHTSSLSSQMSRAGDPPSASMPHLLQQQQGGRGANQHQRYTTTSNSNNGSTPSTLRPAHRQSTIATLQQEQQQSQQLQLLQLIQQLNQQQQQQQQAALQAASRASSTGIFSANSSNNNALASIPTTQQLQQQLLAAGIRNNSPMVPPTTVDPWLLQQLGLFPGAYSLPQQQQQQASFPSVAVRGNGASSTTETPHSIAPEEIIMNQFRRESEEDPVDDDDSYDDTEPDRGILLSLSILSDRTILSPFQQLLRQQILIFRAERTDVINGAQGRNTPIQVGQVGLICLHCSKLPSFRRNRGAVYFPSTLRATYQAAQNMMMNHMAPKNGRCCIPDSLREELFELQQKKVIKHGGGRKYWTQAMASLGIFETEKGLRQIDYSPEEQQQLLRQQEKLRSLWQEDKRQQEVGKKEKADKEQVQGEAAARVAVAAAAQEEESDEEPRPEKELSS